MASIQNAIRLLSDCSLHGQKLLERACQAISLGLGVRWTMVGSLDLPNQSLHLLTFHDQEAGPPVPSIPLAGSPIEAPALGQGSAPRLWIAEGAGRRFPRFAWQAGTQLEAICAQAYPSRSGGPTMLLLALGNAPLADSEAAGFFFDLVGQRIGSEAHRLSTELTSPSLDSLREISEQQSQRADLRRFQKMVSLTEDAICLVDQSFRYSFANSAFLQLFEMSAGEVIGRHVADLIGEDIFEQEFLQCLERSLSGEWVQLQSWMRFASRGNRFIDTRFSPYHEADGSITCVILSSRDITALRSAQDTLRYYERMASGATDMMIFIDSDMVYRAVNQRYLDVFHRQRREIVDQQVISVVGESFFQQFLEPRLRRCLDGHEVSWRMWLDVPQSGPRFIETRYVPFQSPDGELTGIVGNIRDLTQYEQLQTTVARLAGIEAVIAGDKAAAFAAITRSAALALEADRVSIWLLDEDQSRLRNFLLYSKSSDSYQEGEEILLADCPNYAAILKTQRSCEINNALTDPVCSELRESYILPHGVTAILDASIRVSGKLVGILCHETVGGTRTWQAHEVLFACETANLVAQTLINRDRKALESRLAQTQKIESLGLLAGGIAHDFNNLLVGILGSSDLAKRTLPAGSEAWEALQRITQASLRASELCNQLLAYAGKAQPLLETTCLSSLSQGTADLLESSLPPGVALERHLRDDLPLVDVDATQIRQVVMNLITNAADALESREGTILLRTGLADPLPPQPGLPPLRSQVAPQQVYLEVEDSGCGMSEETRARMFDPFFTTKFAGRGLGLAAVQGIIQRHQGTLQIESSLGEGTRIRVLLPTSRREVTDSASAAALPQISHPSAGVLVVDDDEIVRLVAQEILEAEGFAVLCAADGLEALKLFDRRGNDIDIALLDITMPGMGGPATMRELHKRRPDLPVVLTSGFADLDSEGSSTPTPFQSFLKKPYRASELLERIRGGLAAMPAG